MEAMEKKWGHLSVCVGAASGDSPGYARAGGSAPSDTADEKITLAGVRQSDQDSDKKQRRGMRNTPQAEKLDL